MRKANLDSRQVCDDIKNYIDKERNYRNAALTSADVACAIGVSRTSLVNVIRKEMGMTFLQYLEQLRLRHAHHSVVMRKGRKENGQRLTEKEIERIAMLTGFSTVRTFKEKYKKKYGF